MARVQTHCGHQALEIHEEVRPQQPAHVLFITDGVQGLLELRTKHEERFPQATMLVTSMSWMVAEN